MKKIVSILLLSIFLCFIGGFTSYADDEAKEEEADKAMDKDAQTEQGKKMVVQRIENLFHVDQQRIDDLRQKKLGYGEIRHVFSLANQLPGGINDENVNKIMDLRKNQKMGWGRVAQELNLHMGHGKGGHEKSESTESDTDHAKPSMDKPMPHEMMHSRPEKSWSHGKK